MGAEATNMCCYLESDWRLLENFDRKRLTRGVLSTKSLEAGWAQVSVEGRPQRMRWLW